MDDLITIQRQATRAEAAVRLREIADALDAGDGLTLEANGRRADVAVPETVTLGMEYEADDQEHELEIELSWPTAAELGD
jgi:amphi-Trp domain-containing protein